MAIKTLFFLFPIMIMCQTNHDRIDIIQALIEEYQKKYNVDSLYILSGVNNGVDLIDPKTHNRKVLNDSIFNILQSDREIRNFRVQDTTNNLFLYENSHYFHSKHQFYNTDFSDIKKDWYSIEKPQLKIKNKEETRRLKRKVLQVSTPLLSIDGSCAIINFSNTSKQWLAVFIRIDDQWVFYKNFVTYWIEEPF